MNKAKKAKEDVKSVEDAPVEWVDATIPYNSDERNQMLTELLELFREQDLLEGNRQEAAKRYKADADSVNQRMADLVADLRRGTHPVSTECTVHFFPAKNEKHYIDRLGTVVKIVPMEPKDHERTLPL